MKTSFDIAIIGAGTAGITVAARIRKALPHSSVSIIDPAKTHYYQPFFTLVGGGAAQMDQTHRQTSSLIPDGVSWIQESVNTFQPDQNEIVTAEGQQIQYKYLVVAPGIKLDWQKIEGLEGNIGHNGICSNYCTDEVEKTWDFINEFRGGNALFTFPTMPIKCAGAPQKIMYLADDAFRKNGVRKETNVHFYSAGAAIFSVEKYRKALEKVIARKEIQTHYDHNLVAIDADKKIAFFKSNDSDKKVEVAYDMIHVSPPQSAPDFVKMSPLANGDGWVDVDKHSLQHTKYSNIFSLGDASSLPCSKTGAAIRKQAPVLVKNIVAHKNGAELKASYDGYSSCPIVTGYGKLILAEFDYDGNITESFPFDQSKERLSMYLLKKYGLPPLYWLGMMKGRA